MVYRRYEGFSPKDKAVEYFLEIVSDCRELHPTAALDRFDDLEHLFKQEGFNGDLIGKLNKAKNLLNSLESYNTHSKEYFEQFKKFKNHLAEIQEEFCDKYRYSC